ncbi:hypothetical protein AD948_05610 [Acetobacter senegalensis]|uniref:Uncharacterized protein n=1 Tax=Acetobacter senegalensis TaxID=446692 RepID=A0A149U4P4_9PROT|nr:hypothetical protein AD948_05610 [Acetobacter senegalensis]
MLSSKGCPLLFGLGRRLPDHACGPTLSKRLVSYRNAFPRSLFLFQKLKVALTSPENIVDLARQRVLFDTGFK